MNISDLQVNQQKVEIEALVEEISPVREFTKFGKLGRVANASLKDDSGKVQLTLWDDQIELVKTGDKVKIMNAFVKEWQGEKQLSIGKYGTLEILK